MKISELQKKFRTIRKTWGDIEVYLNVDEDVNCNECEEPNEETIEAMKEVEKGKDLHKADSVEELFEKLDDDEEELNSEDEVEEKI